MRAAEPDAGTSAASSGRRAPRRRATIADVAEAAAVSRSTASRALTGRGYAASDVRDRVLAAAERLGYVPDANARSLKERSTRTVGLLVSDLGNPFYAELAAGVSAGLRRHGYHMVLTDGQGAEAEREVVRTYLGARVAGVLTTPVSGQASRTLRREGVPVVEVDRRFTNGCDAVVVDNVGGARSATEHLVGLGHRRVALVVDETEWTTGEGRRQGYAAALRGHGQPVDPALVVRCGFDVDSAAAATTALLGRRRTAPTAVFAVNNVLAEGVWRAVAGLGLRVPEDVSVVAFDDVPWMSMVRPAVTAVAQPTFDLGVQAVELLLSRLGGRTRARTVTLGTELVVRASSGPPPRRR